jgi:hypothetical protein
MADCKKPAEQHISGGVMIVGSDFLLDSQYRVDLCQLNAFFESIYYDVGASVFCDLTGSCLLIVCVIT